MYSTAYSMLSQQSSLLHVVQRRAFSFAIVNLTLGRSPLVLTVIKVGQGRKSGNSLDFEAFACRGKKIMNAFS